MARDPELAKFLSKIEACHTATLPGARLPFHIGNAHAGYVRPEFAEALRAVSTDITVTDRVTLAASAAGQLNAIAMAAGARVRHEDFDVRETPDGPVLAVLDRGALPSFGVIGAGVHLNGYVSRPNGPGPAGPHLWVAKRAAGKKLDPGKLDNLVAGGVPAGLTPFETLIKEAAEEAALPLAIARRARQVQKFAYNMERPEGLRRDVIFAYDLELPESFIPTPTDGEVEAFELWPGARVLECVREDENFKFNVNLVLIDFFLRHGLLSDPAGILRAALES
jgi:8-oxo-dGTP pyrophosphatase MutT (NUDIX family)